jgi:hypothetical protein
LAGFDLAVVKVEPSVLLEDFPITYTVDTTLGDSHGLNIGLGGYAALNPDVLFKTTKSALQCIDDSVQAGYPFLRNRNSRLNNEVIWIFQENVSQKSGHAMVVLLERYSTETTVIRDLGLNKASRCAYKEVIGFLPDHDGFSDAVNKFPNAHLNWAT